MPAKNGVGRVLLPLLGALAVAAVGGLIGAVVTRHFGMSAYSISFADFVVVLLTAVTLIVTVLAFIIGLLAYFGWREFNERVERKVEEQATKFLQEGFKEGNALRQMLESQTKRATYRGVDAVNLGEDEDENEGGVE